MSEDIKMVRRLAIPQDLYESVKEGEAELYKEGADWRTEIGGIVDARALLWMAKTFTEGKHEFHGSMTDNVYMFPSIARRIDKSKPAYGVYIVATDSKMIGITYSENSALTRPGIVAGSAVMSLLRDTRVSKKGKSQELVGIKNEFEGSLMRYGNIGLSINLSNISELEASGKLRLTPIIESVSRQVLSEEPQVNHLNSKLVTAIASCPFPEVDGYMSMIKVANEFYVYVMEPKVMVIMCGNSLDKDRKGLGRFGYQTKGMVETLTHVMLEKVPESLLEPWLKGKEKEASDENIDGDGESVGRPEECVAEDRPGEEPEIEVDSVKPDVDEDVVSQPERQGQEKTEGSVDEFLKSHVIVCGLPEYGPKPEYQKAVLDMAKKVMGLDVEVIDCSAVQVEEIPERMETAGPNPVPEMDPPAPASRPGPEISPGLRDIVFRDVMTGEEHHRVQLPEVMGKTNPVAIVCEDGVKTGEYRATADNRLTYAPAGKPRLVPAPGLTSSAPEVKAEAVPMACGIKGLAYGSLKYYIRESE
jgi:hypothetical protein